jgi:hypothetical protein
VQRIAEAKPSAAALATDARLRVSPRPASAKQRSPKSKPGRGREAVPVRPPKRALEIPGLGVTMAQGGRRRSVAGHYSAAPAKGKMRGAVSAAPRQA